MKETWPDQRKDKENTLREQLQGPILETRDLWNIWSDWRGDMTWPTNTNIKTMTKTNTLRELLQGPIIETCELWDILPEWWGDMTWQTKTMIMIMAKTNTFRAILDTYDLWDTDFNFDNWKPDIMTIIVTWPLRVTLDRITMFVFFVVVSQILKNSKHLGNIRIIVMWYLLEGSQVLHLPLFHCWK